MLCLINLLESFLKWPIEGLTCVQVIDISCTLFANLADAHVHFLSVFSVTANFESRGQCSRRWSVSVVVGAWNAMSYGKQRKTIAFSPTAMSSLEVLITVWFHIWTAKGPSKHNLMVSKVSTAMQCKVCILDSKRLQLGAPESRFFFLGRKSTDICELLRLAALHWSVKFTLWI